MSDGPSPPDHPVSCGHTHPVAPRSGTVAAWDTGATSPNVLEDVVPSPKSLFWTAAVSLAVVVAFNHVQAGGGPRLGA